MSISSIATLIAKDAILVVDGGLRWDDFIDDWRLTAKRIIDLDQAREQYARRPGAALARRSQRRCRYGRYRARAGAATEPWRSLRGRYPLQPRRRQRVCRAGGAMDGATLARAHRAARTHRRTGRGRARTTRLGSTAESTPAPQGFARPRRLRHSPRPCRLVSSNSSSRSPSSRRRSTSSSSYPPTPR